MSTQVIMFLVGQYVLFSVVPAVAGTLVQATGSWIWNKWTAKETPKFDTVLMVGPSDEGTVIDKFDTSIYQANEMLVLERISESIK